MIIPICLLSICLFFLFCFFLRQRKGDYPSENRERCSSLQIYPTVKQCLIQPSSNLSFTIKANARYESY